MRHDTTYKVLFSDDLGQTWRVSTAYAPARKAIMHINDLIARGYDREISIYVERRPPKEDCSHMDCVVPGEEETTTNEQKTLFGESA